MGSFQGSWSGGRLPFDSLFSTVCGFPLNASVTGLYSTTTSTSLLSIRKGSIGKRYQLGLLLGPIGHLWTRLLQRFLTGILAEKEAYRFESCRLSLPNDFTHSPALSFHCQVRS